MSKHRIDRLHSAFVAMLLAGLAACGGGDGNPTYTIGGTISGLAPGSSLTLTDTGSDALTVSTNGPFTFPMQLGNGASYSAAISAAPAQQMCTLTMSAGVVSGAAVKSITVVCIGPFTLG